MIFKKKKIDKKRPEWHKYFLNITRQVATRSTCMSTKHGAIIVKEGRIISSGYNGAPRKTLDCYDRGECLRRSMKIPSGQRYEICRSVHSEQNAIVNAARAGVNIVGADMYVYGVKVFNDENKVVKSYPCFICKKMLINAGLKRFIGYDEDGKIKVYDVEKDFIKPWQKKDMLDDMDVFDSKYYDKK